MIPPPLSITIDLGQSSFSTTGTAYANYLQAHYSGICTNFNHDGTATTFTGNALLLGGHFQVNGGDGTQSAFPGTPPNLSFALVTASFNPTLSQAFFYLTLVNHTSGLTFSAYSTNGEQITRLDGKIPASSIQFAGPNACAGPASYEISGNNLGPFCMLLGASSMTISLTRGGVCSV